MQRPSFPLNHVVIFLFVLWSHFGYGIKLPLDSIWYIPTATSIITEGNADLDEYAALIDPTDDYRIVVEDGHLYNVFPLGVSLAAVPFVYGVRWTTDRLLPFYNLEDVIAQVVPMVGLESFIASVYVAAAAIVIYSIARLSLSRPRALLLTATFVYGTTAWSVASRALWPHAPSMFFVAIGLYLLLRADSYLPAASLAAVPLALAYLMRPTNALVLSGLGLYVLLRYRPQIVAFVLLAAATLMPFMLYNLQTFGTLLPSYYAVDRLGSQDFIEALAGNLISPARGLFVFTPVLLFVFVRFTWRSRENRATSLEWILLLILILHWLVISSFIHWWGGYSFGPRFFTDVLPLFAYLLIPVVGALGLRGQQQTVMTVLFSVTLAVGLFVHAQGALHGATWRWNETPVLIDDQPSRLWDWQDIQFLRK